MVKKVGSEGTILITFVIMFTILAAVVLAVVFTTLQNRTDIERSYYKAMAESAAEAGVDKALWELQRGNAAYNGELANAKIEGVEFDVQVETINSNTKNIITTAYVPSKASPKYQKKVKVKISDEPSTTGVAFRYGVQVGGLGVTMSNNAKVIGNVYSGGTITGANNAEITGDAFVSGPGNKLASVKVGHDGHAHTIQSCNITHDAYYFSNSTLVSTTVGGTKHPASADPEPQNLPLSQAEINHWQEAAESGGTIEGNYLLTNSATASLGPKKINGNLTISNGATLTVTGTLWVTGNINFSNNAIIKLNSSYGANSGIILANNLDNKISYGKVLVSNNVSISGSGNAKSFIMIVSTNTGSTIASPAINAANNSTAVVYYATSGFIEVSNNARLRAVSGGGLHLSNGSQVQYDAGLADAHFADGPGGNWQVREWQEIKT